MKREEERENEENGNETNRRDLSAELNQLLILG